MLHVSHFPALRRVSAPQHLDVTLTVCYLVLSQPKIVILASLTTNFCEHSTIVKPSFDSLPACDLRTSSPILKMIVDSILILVRHL
ncbi:hypothetical protein Plhal703r1_c41g0141551 [Plasmopara halstedii]